MKKIQTKTEKVFCDTHIAQMLGIVEFQASLLDLLAKSKYRPTAENRYNGNYLEAAVVQDRSKDC